MRNKFLFFSLFAVISGLFWAHLRRSKLAKGLDDILYLGNLARDTRRQVSAIERGN
jgi:hypothetical protein